MKASEFIARINELIEVVGDVDVVIETNVPDGAYGYYELAGFETVNCIKCNTPPYGNKDIKYTDNYVDVKDKVVTLLRVY